MKSLLNCKIKVKRARQCLALLLSIFFIFVSYQSVAQYTYFEKRYDFNNNYDRAQNILPVDSGYVIIGITEDSLFYYNYHLSITKISLTGEIIFHKEYGYDSINILIGNPGSLISNNNYYFTSSSYWIYIDDWVHESGLLSCYNSMFDTIWTKKYGETSYPYDTSFILAQMKVADESNFILTGGRMPNGIPSRIWLLKTDSLGNKLWERFYGEGNEYFQGHSVVQTADGGYVIGGFKFKIGYDYTGDPLIIKTDSLGNEEWRINPGNPDVDDNKVMVALAADGNIIAGTNYGTKQMLDNSYAVVKIMKITPDGTVLWDNNYLDPGYDNILLNTTVLDNGNIITNGVVSTFYIPGKPAEISWILCVDSLGNQLWYKEYALLTGENSFNDLYDVIQTTDNGLIGCGRVYPNVPDTGTVDIWVMKMDSMGCLEPDCDTTVDVVETPDLGNKFTLYPNPVTGTFTVKINDETTRIQTFTVYNMYGTKVKEVVIPTGSQSIHIQTTGWQEGVYFGVLSSKGITAATCKFVVRR